MEYEKCLVQVYEILNHLNEEEILKIPESIIRKIEEKKDKSYIWIYDETKDLISQEIDRQTIAILSYINLEYLLNEEEKENIINIHNFNEEKLLTKVSGASFDNIKDVEKNNLEQRLVKINKQKWYQKIWKQIKQIFNK